MYDFYKRQIEDFNGTVYNSVAENSDNLRRLKQW